ncbi:MAG: hypothetical protein A2Y38_10725 [Spirochaetes bacterium GWB1_59_5]|nr:MAG: hypothetical protein A2Y38_10725 [Spirochaetes bacterium GWB1_59_5]
MGLWNDIERVLSPCREDREYAARLVAGLEDGLSLATTQTALLRSSDAAIAAFYALLETTRPPVESRCKRSDSSWILESDLCWINVRACSIDDVPGSFVRAAKLLPAVTSDAILLAPFHPTQFDLSYAPETMTIADPALADPVLAAAGISPENQLRAFVAACGLLGKSVGYELLPYASQFSRIAMERPRLFRWVALDDTREGLEHADPEFPYRAEDRLRDADLVSSIVATAKEDYGIPVFRRHEDDTVEILAAKDRAYYSAIRLCIDHGLWPVPAHARNGVGIPAFLRYDGGNDFPVFSYRDADGSDIGEDAYSIVAPFAFYDDMPTNSAPTNTIHRNQDAIDYYAHVFTYWRDSFGFDFVRYNAVDRIFEESLDEEGCVPASDRPSPEILKTAIMASRDGAPGTGAVASRKGPELEDYAELGFDLNMGNEALRRIDAPLVHDALALYDRLVARAEDKRPASVCFSIDVPESGAPRLWGSALSRVMGPERMRLRHGAARFLSVGRGRRPMFETMGFQDGSIGLYEAGLSIRGLEWADDKAFAVGYASIERLHKRMKSFLAAAYIAERHVEPGYAWWQIRGAGRTRLIVAVVSLETAEGVAPGRISIPLDPAWGDMEGRAYRLPDSVGVGLEAARSVQIDLSFLDFVVVDLAPAFY